MNNELFAPVKTEANTSALDILRSKLGTDFLPNLRVFNPTSQVEIDCRPGDWFVGDIPLKSSIEIYLGPWRMAGRRFRNDKMDLESFNQGPESVYVADKNDWKHPHGYTKKYLEIMNKEIPDDGMKCSNKTGIDFLVWIAELRSWAVYFVAGISMKQKCINDFFCNRGSWFMLSSARGKGKFHYYVPEATEIVNHEPFSPSPDTESVMEKFFNMPAETDEEVADR